MNDHKTLLVQKDDRVLRITMNRPEVRNAQNREMLDELNQVFLESVMDESVGVIILCGAGKDFCSGHDISPEETSLESEFTWEERYLLSQELYLDYTVAWRELPKPMIAQVQGNCIMGGLMIALACDFIICSDDALFLTRMIAWGNSNLQYCVLPWAIGVPQAKQYMFTGDPIDANRARELGLANAVVPRAELEAFTMNLAKRIADFDPFALRMAKRICNAVLDIQGQRSHLDMAFQTWAVTSLRPAILGRWEAERGFATKERIKSRDEKIDES